MTIEAKPAIWPHYGKDMSRAFIEALRDEGIAAGGVVVIAHQRRFFAKFNAGPGFVTLSATPRVVADEDAPEGSKPFALVDVVVDWPGLSGGRCRMTQVHPAPVSADTALGIIKGPLSVAITNARRNAEAGPL